MSLSHFLIGLPGAGKSTFCQRLNPLGHYTLVSPDQIRAQFYGDTLIQGDWGEIEQEVLRQVRASWQAGKPVIYDATNAKRVWRMTLLQKLPPEMVWVGWHLITPLETCRQWNQQRSRVVPDFVLERMHQSLQQFPPWRAEGFVALYPVLPHECEEWQIQDKLASLGENPPSVPTFPLHRYSKLVDFERLLHLIALFLSHPSLDGGNIEGICEVMEVQRGRIYAEGNAIAQDIEWLAQQGIVQGQTQQLPTSSCVLSPLPSFPLIPHPYSNFAAFERLVSLLRFILYPPLRERITGKPLPTVVHILTRAGLDNNNLLEDIQLIIKPYGLGLS
ncbi:ATP-binding protein [Spirulina subsalsa FACHB-351]|uniref:ATP-binding protein n=1 Tax=Spirulina subsalsa FACHB-351 TaxID=234711 RepID=A0ABT3L2P9_9CYAN|nr:ATP-binding protein [Spirulina subsalsa]MCW6035364.1 ATP-binding protein [Spirulina subsalsa FACHB-351]